MVCLPLPFSVSVEQHHDLWGAHGIFDCKPLPAPQNSEALQLPCGSDSGRNDMQSSVQASCIETFKQGAVLQEEWRRGEIKTTVKVQPMPLTLLNALFQAMQRPTAVFLPFMGYALSLRSLAALLDVCYPSPSQSCCAASVYIVSRILVLGSLSTSGSVMIQSFPN